MSAGAAMDTGDGSTMRLTSPVPLSAERPLFKRIRSFPARGRAEIRAVPRESRRLFVPIGLSSAFVNLLMLTGPLFMLQI